MTRKLQIAKEMAREIGSDLYETGMVIGTGLTYIVTRFGAMPVVGNLPQRIKKEIYRKGCFEELMDDESDRLSRYASIVSIAGNLAAAGINMEMALTGNDTIDNIIMGYAIVDGIARAYGMRYSSDNKESWLTGENTPVGTSPGSLVGGIVAWPLWGLKEYLKSTYRSAVEKVEGTVKGNRQI